MKILLVDDSKLIRAILKDVLGKLGFKNIHEAQNGRVGLEKLKEEGEFDFVFSDWMMPGMDGITLLKEVRADEELQNIIFVMLSAESINDKVDEATKHGADAYITKPFKPEKIEEEIENILKRRSEK